MHVKSRSRALSTVYFQGIYTAIMYIVHVATFGQMVAPVNMFCIVRMVVKFINIMDSYKVAQATCHALSTYQRNMSIV